MNPQALMAAVLAAGLACAGAYFWGRHDGRALERGAWEQRESEALRAANAALDAMHAKVREQERKHAADQAQIVLDYEKELGNVETERDSALARVRSGDIRLRAGIATADRTCEMRVFEATAGATASKPAAPEGGLPAARDGDSVRAERAIALLSEADEQARELNLCWAVVRRDRE